MDPRRTVSPESALASDIFDKFCSANTLKSILGHYRQLCSVLRIKPTHFPDFYPRLKSKLSSWRAQGLWAKFEKRASHKCYGRGKACAGNRVLIIGSGPCGLRAAIEAQLLGAKVVLIEKRDRFSRNNVLHLWPFVITDLKGLGAKKFYGKFCAGSIDHISIRQLQCILLKVALLLGVEVHEGVSFEGLRSPADDNSQSGWRCHTIPSDHPVSHYTFDVLIGADGRRNTLDGFRRKALRAKLAIAITANFINKHTEAEARVKEISGVSYIFNQKFFQELNEATGIDLENIVYYKDETHYFVMTAKKQSLLQKGVLLHDYADTAKLLSHENISTENLMIYAMEAAIFSTENQLPNLDFAVNHYGQPDVAMFDFTAMYQAENACRIIERNKQRLLMTLVGDSLLEPFWPTGSGCARGFLSSFDACWMIRSWAQGTKGPLEVMAERESIYRLLAQTTPENLNKEHTSYTIDPHSRYPNLNLRAVMPFQVKSLLDSDEPLPLDALDAAVIGGVAGEGQLGVKKRRRDSVIAVDHLLTWLREQCQCYNLELNDVRDAFSSGEVLCAIIHRFRPDLIEEYPLPSEENVDPVECAGFRNQLAFDLLHAEYGLQHVMSGWESVQGAQAQDFLSCVAYLSQVYEIFRGEIPQVKWGAAAGRMESCEDLEEAVLRQAASSQQQFKYTFKTTSALGGGSSSKHHYGAGKTPGRKSRMSSSGRESRGDGGDSSEISTGRRHKKRRSEDRTSRAGAMASSSSGGGGNSVSNYLWSFLGKFNPYSSIPPPASSVDEKPARKKMEIDPEEQERRRQDIERNRADRQKRRKQERMLQTERFIKSMRLLHLNDRGALQQMQREELEAEEEKRKRRRGSIKGGAAGGGVDEGDEDFYENGSGEEYDDEGEGFCGDDDEQYSDYTFHLYRTTAPIFQERLKTIEQKLAGREIRTTFGNHRRGGRGGGSGGDDDSEKNVPGLARDLEAKLKGRTGGESGGSSSSTGNLSAQQKPKDLIRAIGKIEKTDWNVQLIEKKIAESKGPSLQKAERDDKVPKWSREAFDDKREALKRKMEGLSQQAQQGHGGEDDKMQLFEETMKKLGCKLRDGNSLEVGQRGSNKVSAMAEQLVHKLEKCPPHSSQGHQHQNSSSGSGGIGGGSSVIPRPIFEFPKKGGSESCHFCKERVYVVERMTAEGKYFHRNCFRCEYCNTALRVGKDKSNYVFDREGRYGDRFFCTSHYNTIWLYGWKKYDQEAGVTGAAGGSAGATDPSAAAGGTSLVVGGDVTKLRGPLTTPTSQQILSEMDERGTTPERVEFENSVECASEDDLLSEMDEDEWTDRNFGASNADNLTPDEASDLSDDDITPEGINLKAVDDNHPEGPRVVVEPPLVPGEEESDNAISIEQANILIVGGKGEQQQQQHADSSDSDTEVASGDDEDSMDDEEELEDEEEVDDEEDDGEEDEDDEEDEEEEEEEGGGSTTEIETDSEFAEDPPHSVPGTIPTIVVDEPEQIVTRMIDMPISHTQTPTLKRNTRGGGTSDPHHNYNTNHHHNQHNKQQPTQQAAYHIEDLNQRMVEPVKKTTVPERPLPRVTAVPKKWEPLNINPEGLASKMSLELKKKYMLHGGAGPLGMAGVGQPTQHKNSQGSGGAAQSQFRSVLDMISEQQKLLQPAARPSATMQAFLDGAEKLKQKPNISPMSASPKAVDALPQQQQNATSDASQQRQLESTQTTRDGGTDDGDVTPTPPSPRDGGVGSNPWINSDVVVVMNGEGGPKVDNTLSMNRLNLEKSAAAAAAAAAQQTQAKYSPVGEKQDVGREKQEVVVVNGGGGHDHENRDHPAALMVLSSEGLSQSETETQSTIIAVNKGSGGDVLGGATLEDDQKTPVAEKPFEHNVEPGKDRVVLALGGMEGQNAEEEEDSDTETGDDSLSDQLEEDYEEEDGPQVKREPPRVEIEDEFGGVTLAVDVDQEIDESIRISSSDSRDSLNSGVFLETELSDWVKEGGTTGEIGGGGGEEGGHPVKNSNYKGTRKHHHHQKGKRLQGGAGSNAGGGSKPPLCLDLEDMDFMDVDGLSSPEDAKILRKVGGMGLGYTKLEGEEENQHEEEDDQPESILPDFSVVLRTTHPHDTQPSPNTLERQQRPTYSSDEREDESGHSSTPTVEDSVSKDINQRKELDHHRPRVPEVNEAVNPVMVKEIAALQAGGKELPRKGPFSNARDSLDYRKMRTTGNPAVVKSKDLYSTWMKGGIGGGDLLAEENSSGSSASSGTTSTTSGGNPVASPEMARKIEEIHKERAKQNDLIRSMVMGRIRKSPEKNSRRGSRGSLSPLGGGSSSGSGSGSAEHVLKACAQSEDVDSRRSSQNSILSRETEEEEDVEIDVPSTTTTTTTSSGSIPHQKLVKSSSQTTQSTGSATTTSQSPPDHQQQQQQNLPHAQYQPQYSPVFSSSPRFRHRPKFETPLSVYQSVTNPPTPVNPSALTQMTTPSSENGGNSGQGGTTTPTATGGKSMKMFKSHSPSFYRSMPDLSAFLVSPLPGHHATDEGSDHTSGTFATPDVNKWEHYKHHRSNTTSGGITSVDREKARQAARERARLKSDEELGLSPTDYANLKEKVRRKASVPTDDDVFVPPTVKLIGGSVPTTPVKESLRGGVMFPPGGRRLARPMSDVFDAAFSLRPNVDFPIAKTNPFLVSGGGNGSGHPQYPSNPYQQYHDHPVLATDNSAPGSGGAQVGRGEVATEWYNYHEQTPPPPPLQKESQEVRSPTNSAQNYERDDGFLHLQLRLSGSKPSERKISPEKAKSMGWSGNGTEGDQYPMSPPNYFSSTSSPAAGLTSTPTHPARGTPSSLTARADGNWFFDSKMASTPQSGVNSRPRSNTLSDLNLSPSSLNSPGNNDQRQGTNENGNDIPASTTTSAQGTSPNNNSNAQSAQTPQVMGAPSTPKAKALSTDTLLDSQDHPSPLTENKGASVPDISQHAEDVISHHPNNSSTTTAVTSPNNNSNNNAAPARVTPPERKNRKSKDRDRRRSLIQAVSDFFTIRGSSSSSTASGGAGAGGTGTPSTGASNNVSPTDKSSSQHTTATTSQNSSGSNGIHHGYHQVGGAVDGGTSDATVNGKERFSIFKLTPTKILQSAKERRNSKSREVLVSPPPPAPSSPPRSGGGAVLSFHQPQQPQQQQQQQQQHYPSPHHGHPHQVIDPNNPPPKPARAAQYLSQPEMVIQRLTQSPTTYKSHRTSRGGGANTEGYDHTGSTPTLAGLGTSSNVSDHMAALSIVATPVKPARSSVDVVSSGGGSGGSYLASSYRNRMREMQEIQLQLESVDQQQRSLEARGVAVEKRIRGEVVMDREVEQADEQELMEEWFTLVREKTRLARWEKELLVRAEELELEARKERLEEQLDNSLLLKDDIKSPQDKNREIELLHQLRAVEEQRGKLLTSFQDDMRQYEDEDADLEAKIQSSRLSPKESNV